MNIVNAGDARAANAEMTRSRLALQRQQDEALVALLGTSGFTQSQVYQTTRGARTQAVSMGSQLLQMGLPLTSAQLKPLTTALIAEQQRQRQKPSREAQTRTRPIRRRGLASSGSKHDFAPMNQTAAFWRPSPPP